MSVALLHFKIKSINFNFLQNDDLDFFFFKVLVLAKFFMGSAESINSFIAREFVDICSLLITLILQMVTAGR